MEWESTVSVCRLWDLGFASAQKVTKLTSCLTKEKNLRMDCEYELTAATPVPTCTYTQENNVVGSTDPAKIQDPTFKNRGAVAIMEGISTCRLNLTGLSDDKPKNFTCTIKQKETVSKTSTVEKSKYFIKLVLVSLLHS